MILRSIVERILPLLRVPFSSLRKVEIAKDIEEGKSLLRVWSTISQENLFKCLDILFVAHLPPIINKEDPIPIPLLMCFFFIKLVSCCLL